jgi:hypothetical protein
MKHNPTSKVVDVLLNTLERVEERADSRPDEAALQKLRSRIFRMVAQFEAVRSREEATAGSRE